MTDTPSRPAPQQACPECRSLTVAPAVGEFKDWDECRECGHRWSYRKKAPQQAQAAPQVSRMFIHSICTAYESGLGRGASGRDLMQPYDPESPQGIAYHEGWTQGIDRYNDGADDE